MYRVFFIKNNRFNSVSIPGFWELARSGHFQGMDLIFDSSSQKFLHASDFLDLRPYLPQQDWVTELVGGIIKIATVFIGIRILAEAFTPEPQSPPRRRKLQPNYEPLESWKKSYIRERDEHRCNYCGGYASRGHVDHKTSRINGGSNRINNLCWACAPCNLTKGRRNAPEFRKLLKTM
jgi:hypothetical protein